MTSCKQLDFDWPQSSQKPKNEAETGEIGASTTGRPPSNDQVKQDRLFVPLATQPFEWFKSGAKRWELRKLGRQYTPKHLRVGRSVELRKGYKGPDSIWAAIIDVVEAANIEEFFDKVDYKEVIPVAEGREQAIEIASEILKADEGTPIIGFSVGFA